MIQDKTGEPVGSSLLPPALVPAREKAPDSLRKLKMRVLEASTSGSVALATDERDVGGDECQVLKLDGFFLPMYKTGRQKTARYCLPAEADLCGSCA